MPAKTKTKTKTKSQRRQATPRTTPVRRSKAKPGDGPKRTTKSGAAHNRSAHPTETDIQAASRARRILDRLEKAHPEAECALSRNNPYELVAATILSAQCTDERVNQVTPALFRRYPRPSALATAVPAELEKLIRSTGFFRSKARSLIGCAAALVEHHGGRVPKTLAELVRLPGVGRKTANVVLSHAFNLAEGIAVDTHVSRVVERLELTSNRDAQAAEARLMQLVPQKRWTRTTDLLIFHGRKVCDARKPACGDCPIFDLCLWQDREAFAMPGAAPPAAHKTRARPRDKTTAGA